MHAIGMRDVNKSVFKMKHLDNPYMLLAWGVGIALQALVTEIPYLVSLFEALQKGAGEISLKKAVESEDHKNEAPQPGEAV